jgi:cbb3-type cytochrome oxidase cytochrome c subunit
MRHETIEKSMNLMIVLIILAVSIGGLVEIIPLMLSSETTEPAENIEPYSPRHCVSPGATYMSAKAAMAVIHR